MTTDLTPYQPADLALPLERARALIEETTPANTKRAFESDCAHFAAWCAAHSALALPAAIGTVVEYLIDCKDRYIFKLSTIERRLSSISKAHQQAGVDNPTKNAVIHETMKALRRSLGRAQTQKAPAVTDIIKAMLDTLGAEPAGLRDKALLLVGFAGPFRRGELVALDIGDLQFVPSGVVITLRRSKTDQEGQGRKIGIPMGLFVGTCPVRALRAWIEAAELVSGALFRPIDRHQNIKASRLTAHAVTRIVKRAAYKARLDESAFSGHSLRAGLATAAAAAGASDRTIMKQTGHKSRAMVDRYVRSAELFNDNAGGSWGCDADNDIARRAEQRWGARAGHVTDGAHR